ncbi:MAG: hypothetical protein QOD53_388 [Thermoleophilaceae bacterium]|nr:hypothetical protein [Thermoleophilaceae bacterium]
MMHGGRRDNQVKRPVPGRRACVSPETVPLIDRALARGGGRGSSSWRQAVIVSHAWLYRRWLS